MTDTLLNLLSLVLLALLYLFFAREVWSVWSEVRSPATAGVTQGAAGDEPRKAKRQSPAHTPTTPTRLVDIVTGADWPLPTEGTSI